MMVFGSKVQAILAFVTLLQNRQDIIGQSFDDFIYNDSRKIIDNLMRNGGWPNVLREWYRNPRPVGVTNFDIYMKDVVEPFFFPIFEDESEVKRLPIVGTTSLYPTDPSPYWNEKNMPAGFYDNLDQPLCQFAQFLGVDTLLFQHEMGEKRAVSEILDTRPRSEDYLYKAIGRTTPWWEVSPRYPTIWFKKYGFVTTGPCNVEINRLGVVVSNCC